MILAVIEDGAVHIAFVFRQVGAFIFDGPALSPHLAEDIRLHQADDVVSQDILFIPHPEEPAGLGVDLLYFQVIVEHQDAVGGVGHHRIGKSFRLFHHVGQAHGLLRLAPDHRRRLFPAGIVAAAAAVELILRRGLSHLGQNIFDLRFRGLVLCRLKGREGTLAKFLGRLLHREVFLPGIAQDLGHILGRACGVLAEEGAVCAASLAGGQLDKAAV